MPDLITSDPFLDRLYGIERKPSLPNPIPQNIPQNIGSLSSRPIEENLIRSDPFLDKLYGIERGFAEPEPVSESGIFGAIKSKIGKYEKLLQQPIPEETKLRLANLGYEPTSQEMRGSFLPVKKLGEFTGDITEKYLPPVLTFASKLPFPNITQEPIITPEIASKIAQISSGFQRGATSLVEDFSTPTNIAIMATLGIKSIPNLIKRGISGGFGISMVKPAYDQWQEAKSAYDAGDIRSASQHATEAAGLAFGSVAGLSHALLGGKAKVGAKEEFVPRETLPPKEPPPTPPGGTAGPLSEPSQISPADLERIGYLTQVAGEYRPTEAPVIKDPSVVETFPFKKDPIAQSKPPFIPTPTKAPPVRESKGIQLSEDQKLSLQALRSEIAGAEAGKRIFREGATGTGGTMEVIGVGSTFPIQNLGSKQHQLSTIDSVLEGKTLTEKQGETFQRMQEHIEAGLEEHLYKQEKEARKPQELITGDLNLEKGDVVKIPGDTLKVLKSTTDNLVLKDGIKLNLDPVFGKIMVEGGERGIQRASDAEKTIISPIDLLAPKGKKVSQLIELSKQNESIINSFLKNIDEEFGTTSKYDFKEPQQIISKSVRPSILAKKPWFDVEHIRDSLRFKTILDNIDQLPEIENKIKGAGFEIVKKDTDKLFEPREWGWRLAVYDLRMPNGQIVEYYMPVKEIEVAKKAGNHTLFEKWRDKDSLSLTPEQKYENEKDVKTSRDRYNKAWNDYLKRTGQTERALRASLTSRETVSGSLTGEKLSLRSSPVTGPSVDQTPFLRSAPKPLSMTKILPSSLSTEASAIKEPPFFGRMTQEKEKINKIIGQEPPFKPSTKPPFTAQAPETTISPFLPMRAEKAPEIAEKGPQKAKPEEFKSRVYERLKQEHPEELTEDITYQRLNMQRDAENAVTLINQDKQKAYQVAMGGEQLPDQTSTGVNIAMAEKMLEEGNFNLYAQLVKKRSLDQTRRGQEIVMEKNSVTDNSASRYVKELIHARMEKIGDKFLSNIIGRVKGETKPKKTERIIREQVEKAQKQIGKKRMDIREAQALLDRITCK